MDAATSAAIAQLEDATGWHWIARALFIFYVVCKIVTIVLPPPAANSRLVGIYRLMVLVAGHFGWSRNAVVPGMTPEERAAANSSAKALAKNPSGGVTG